MDQPLVSIICITYNHGSYITQALEGFLMQKTSFQYEILIGEDCSTDNTRQICIDYLEKYPDLIKLISSGENVGTIENFKRTVLAAQGQYMALCEGDDYWTDPLKLQKQVDFLNDNPDYAIVHTNKKVLLDDKIYDDKPVKINSGEVFEDLICSNSICTLTVLVRSEIFKVTVTNVAIYIHDKNWFVPDYAFWLYIALEYKIGYLNDITGVYRFLPESLSHSLNPRKALSFDKCIIDIKEFYYKEYLKKNHNDNRRFRLRFKENVFHHKKRLLLDYGLLAKREIFSLLKTNPIVYFYIIYKKLKKFKP